MSLLSQLRSWLDAALQRPRIEREMDMDVELRHYFETYTEDLLRSGVSRAEAERRARLQLGGMENIKEECRDARGARMLETLLQDLRFALRVLRKNPGFTAVAVLTLALGIGANTAVFSVVNAVLLHPLPYKDPSRLVWIDYSTPRLGHLLLFRDYSAWRNQNRVFEDIAGGGSSPERTIIGSESEQLNTTRVTANFFQLLGVQPKIGRSFLLEETRPGGLPVAIITDAFCRRKFPTCPSVLGRLITLDGDAPDSNTSYTIVGVLPSGFEFPSHGQPDVVLPVQIADNVVNGAVGVGQAIARLRPGISVSTATANLDTISAAVRPGYPSWLVEILAGGHSEVVPLHDHLVGDNRLALLVLMGSVGFVLLIACANVANLQLARAVAREREIAIRSALGAKPWRLARQLLTECCVIAIAGGGLGLLLASWLVALVRNFGPPNVPHLADARLDPHVLFFTITLSLLVGVLFGLAPVLANKPAHLNEPLKEGGARSGAAASVRRPQKILTIAEVALSLVLFVGAGLLVRTLQKLASIPPGCDPHHILVVGVSVGSDVSRTSDRWNKFFEDLINRFQTLPEVLSVGAVRGLPHQGGETREAITIDGRPVPPVASSDLVVYNMATPDYFSTLRIPLVAGRFLDNRDLAESQRVPLGDSAGRSTLTIPTLVNQAFVHRYFPNENPLQKTFRRAPGSGPVQVIVGVVANVPRRLAVETEPECFVPGYAPYLVVRSSGDPLRLVSAVREQISAVGTKSVSIESLETMDHMFAGETASRRFSASILSGFAALAVLLAAVGIYGVMAYAVSQRTREIGVRMALGAESGNVLRMVLGQGLRLALTGVAIGLTASFGLTRIMRSMLYGVTASDPLTFCFVTTVLVAAALAACYIPARRAMLLDPLEALRNE